MSLLFPGHIDNIGWQALDSVVESEQLPGQVGHVGIGGEGGQVHQGVCQDKHFVQVRVAEEYVKN